MQNDTKPRPISTMTDAGSTDHDAITVQVDDAVALVTISRPHVRNALRTADVQILASTLSRLADNQDVRTVMIVGSEGFFCAGAELGADSAADAAADNRAMMSAVRAVTTTLLTSRLTFIAAVEGGAVGLGASIAFACDLVIAAEEAYFLLPFTNIGLMPDGGATATVAASIGRARAMRYALRGERIFARAACDAGLIAEVCASDELRDTTAAWARALADGASDAIAATKWAINELTIGPADDVLSRETDNQLRLLSSADFQEGVAASRARRPAIYRRRG